MAFQTGTVTGYLTLLTTLRDFVTGESLTAAAVNAGGSGYVVGDVLTVSGGTSTVAAQVEVTAESGGAVTSVKIVNGGSYTAAPSSPASTTGGSGTGCTLDVTFTDNGWTAQRDVLDSGERELILEGVGSGSDEIFVGIRTYQDTGVGAFNWELAGFTGYSSGLDWDEQPGISPGRFDDAPQNGGAFVPLTTGSISYWFFADGRRIIIVAKVGSTYCNAYLGFVNPFATAVEYPYPLAVFGCTGSWNRLPGSTAIGFSGLVDPIAHSTAVTTIGPAYVRFTDGGWHSVQNGEDTGSGRNRLRDLVVLPAGLPQVSGLASRNAWFDTSETMQDVIPATGNPGNPARVWQPTPDSGGDIYTPFPATIAMSTPSRQLVGELDAVFWLAGQGGVVSEDTLMVGSDEYIVFQNCNRSDPWAFLCIKLE